MVSPILLRPPTVSDPAHTTEILQQAPKFLKAQQAFAYPYPLSLLVNNESQEKWAGYENILLASLETGEYETAQQCLTALTERFGKLNEKVLVLQGVYDEATAQDEKDLAKVLKKYDDVLTESPTMIALRKRRVALLKSMSRLADAVSSLVETLDISPTDAEAWAELSDLYLSQGNIEKALFCLEEVMLIMPNSWNMQAKFGEVLLLSAKTTQGDEALRVTSEAIRRFCRSAELCNAYLRAFYGLKVATSQLLTLLGEKTSSVDGVLPRASIQKLNQVATGRLAEIIKDSRSGSAQSDGYSPAELAAAQSLLSTGEIKQIR